MMDEIDSREQKCEVKKLQKIKEFIRKELKIGAWLVGLGATLVTYAHQNFSTSKEMASMKDEVKEVKTTVSSLATQREIDKLGNTVDENTKTLKDIYKLLITMKEKSK